jgi:cell division protein FtsZ
MNIDELPIQWQENKSSIIKVVGVGGGGGNAVTHMYRQGIHNVNFVICNTDAQALDASPVPVKIRIGDLGAGGDPELGRIAAMEALDKIREVLDTGTKMVFLTAGMGGGTGTGATPVIARVAKDLGILTVAIVTMPFAFEGPQRIAQAKEGINELKDFVDSLLIINNEKLREMYGDLTVIDAFEKADNVLTMAARGIAELITLPGIINVDFKDEIGRAHV